MLRLPLASRSCLLARACADRRDGVLLLIFPAAYVAHGSALTILLIVAGLAGLSELAAEMAVIQGALLATFHAFSANARSLILQGHDDLSAERLLAKRAIAGPVAALASYALCVGLAGVSEQLALLLIARRACEWMTEVRLCEIEVAADRRAARRALAVQASLTAATACLLVYEDLRIPALGLFAISPLVAAAPGFTRKAFRLQVLLRTLRGASPHIGSTAIEGISTYVLRLVVFVIAGREMSGLLFTAFALGSFAATLFANIVGPTLALRRARNAGRSASAAVWFVIGAMARLAPSCRRLWMRGSPPGRGSPPTSGSPSGFHCWAGPP